MKHLSLTVVITLFFFSLQAQFELGIQGGASLSKIQDVYSIGAKISNAPTYFIGISPRYNITERLGVIVDIQYALKGYDAESAGIHSNLTDRRFDFIDFEGQLEYRFLKQLAASGGIYYGTKVNEKRRKQDGDWVNVRSNFQLFNKSDFGLTFGLRAYFNRFTFFAKYQQGISDFSNFQFVDDNGELLPNTKDRNQNIMLGVGYLIIKS